MGFIFHATMAWRTVWKAQRGRERPCDATVAFRCVAVTYDTLRTHLIRPVSFLVLRRLRIFSPVQAVHGTRSRSPEISKPCWRQFGVAHRVLDIPVAEVSLQGSGVMPLLASATRRHGQHVGRLGLLLALHWGVPHDLFNTCLIQREL
jgi:hypothetical protein